MVDQHRGCRILVVDDDPEFSTIVANELSQDPSVAAKVERADSFAEATARIESGEYDLYLFDYHLDASHCGVELIDQVTGKGAPVIMMTSSDEESVWQQAFASGAADYFRKTNLRSGMLPVMVRNNLIRGERLRQLERRQRLLAREARRDSLTGLPNRRALADLLSLAHGPVPGGRRLALLYVDLDGFKPVNDEYGHHAGDQVLRAVSLRLLGLVREDDMVARIGGDEFAIAVRFSDEMEGSEEVLRRLGQEVINLIELPVRLQLQSHDWSATGAGYAAVKLSASVGITYLRDDDRSADDVIRAADRAMYVAKNAGGGRMFVVPGRG